MKKPITNSYCIFISSVQKELAAERRALKDFITHDPMISRFISDVFLFEEIPAVDRKPDDIYLNKVAGCDIYIAILGNEIRRISRMGHLWDIWDMRPRSNKT